MTKATEKTVETPEKKSEQKGEFVTRRGATYPFFSFNLRDFFTLNPFEMMKQFTEEMDKTFGGFGLWRGFEKGAIWSPAIEVFEKDGKLIVRAELPGVDKDNVKIEMTDEGLVVKGERKSEHKEEDKEKGFFKSEMTYGSFFRRIPLPEGVKFDDVKAHFTNGVLEITVPVPELVTKKREIPIQSEASKTQTAVK
jgi:HSP20 family protein